MDVCDRIQVLDQGRTLAEGRPRDPREPRRRRRLPRRERRARGRSERPPHARARRARGRATAPCAAVRGLDLEVGRGEIVGLIGPNGAGKSTTLHAIMGARRRVARATIQLGGRRSRGRPPEQIARAGIALVPEGRRIFAELTVEENLRLGLAGRRERARRAADIERSTSCSRSCASSAGGTPARSRAASSSSSRSAARSSREPDLLLLDEPSLGLSPSVDVVFEALAAIRERGLTVLLVEQRAQRTVAFADRTYVIANGELRLTLGARRRRRHRALSRRVPAAMTLVRPRRTCQTLVDASRSARLRADRRRDRPGLRRPAAGQLRLRPADHGRRLHAGVHLDWPARPRCIGLLRGRRRALAARWSGSSSGRCARPRRRSCS